MALSTWWHTDPLPTFPNQPGFLAKPVEDYELLARINQITLLEVHARRFSGHKPFMAYLDGQPAAYGWVAAKEAKIGELGLTFSLPIEHRYLWDFATLPAFRGKGMYPRLLQAILLNELPAAEYFWIIHAPENLPSGIGIDRAGFKPVGQLSFQLDGSVGLQPFDDLLRAQMGASLMGVPLIDTILSPCWCCGGAAEHHCGPEEALACWPPLNPASLSPCTCAVPIRSHPGT